MSVTIPVQATDRAQPASLGGTRTDAIGPPLELPGSAVLVPVVHGGRPVGAYVASGGRVRYQPVVDLRQAVAVLVVVCGATTAAAALLSRRHRGPAIGKVTMGPGGWVSFKGVTAPALRPSARPRPWWARLLRARRLVVES
ncbi:MAG TPA: hypothetical protein VF462_02385 [Micromonosporaceae bacterium]